jgi:hypothetical protein
LLAWSTILLTWLVTLLRVSVMRLPAASWNQRHFRSSVEVKMEIISNYFNFLHEWYQLRKTVRFIILGTYTFHKVFLST